MKPGSTCRYTGWLPSALWCVVIYGLSSQSDFPEPDFWLPPFTDKMIHAALYSLLALLLYPWLRRLGQSPFQAARWALVVASIYGMTDEWHQAGVPGRDADGLDWLADTIGASIVFWIAWREARLKPWFNRLGVIP